MTFAESHVDSAGIMFVLIVQYYLRIILKMKATLFAALAVVSLASFVRFLSQRMTFCKIVNRAKRKYAKTAEFNARTANEWSIASFV